MVPRFSNPVVVPGLKYRFKKELQIRIFTFCPTPLLAKVTWNQLVTIDILCKGSHTPDDFVSYFFVIDDETTKPLVCYNFGFQN